ncbi:asparagine synthase-related protein [Haliea sp. E17]|uniref:asparagine synthase-related protein n=1 Tax=Haliea sp. E17 TaxID=3401576 RepID=UPI003AAB67F7
MARELAHRGPDGVGFSASGSLGLGHCALHATAESKFDQLPHQCPDSGLSITADARLDNRDSLISELRLTPDDPSRLADSRIILAAYRRWGASCVDHLLGDFAFVICDQPRNTLFCARDHMGCKPFYYSKANGTFVFASSALGVIRGPGVPAEVSPGRVADYLVEYLEGLDRTATFFAAVSRLPAGCTMTVNAGEFRVAQYWTPGADHPLHLGSDEAYVDALEELFRDAVRVRLRGLHQPASMLSGGLDSSTVVGVASNLLGAGTAARPILTLSATRPGDLACLETRYSKQVVNSVGAQPVYLTPDAVGSYAAELEQWCARCEDPFDLMMIVPALTALAAREQGARYLLDGVDGDIVAGLPVNPLPFLLRQRELGHFLGELRRLGESGDGIPWRRAFRSVLAACQPRWARRRREFGRTSARMHALLSEAGLDPAFARAVRLDERFALDARNNHFSLGDSLMAVHANILGTAFLSAGIERYERSAAAMGLEARHPFLDKRIVEFFLNLPHDQKVRGGVSKFLLRQLAARYLPEPVAQRVERQHVGMLYHGWFRELQQQFCPPGTTAELAEQLSAWLPPQYALKLAAGENDQNSRRQRVALLVNWLQNNLSLT